MVLNELLANPDGTDRGSEFVEILNTAGEAISLEGWSLSDGTGATRHVFSGTLQAGTALVLFDEGEHLDVPGAIVSTTTYLSLNNTGDTITLMDEDGVTVDVVSYGTASSGISWNRLLDGQPPSEETHWVEHTTLSEQGSSPGTLADGSPF